MEGKTVIIFASGYDAPPTSKHHVAHILARNNTIIWVNYHASRTPSVSTSDVKYIFRKLGQVFRGTKKVRENLYVTTPLVVPLPGSRLAKWLNARMLVGKIRRLVKKYGKKPVQVWSFTPDVAYIVKKLSPEKVLYYCVDDFSHFSGYDSQQVARDENELISMSDLVVTTSQQLFDARSKGNDKTILVTHGVDYDHFARALDENLRQPADLEKIPHPRIGFFGLIRDWVDLKTVAEIARRQPEWQFVFLGDSTVDLSEYRKLANMHFLGARRYEELPAYCRGFDVGLIPFAINELTKAVNPIKLREYLSAALPVVSSPMGEVEKYAARGLARIARTPDEYILAIQDSLKDTKECRMSYSQAMCEETWPAKMELICSRLSEANRQ